MLFMPLPFSFHPKNVAPHRKLFSRNCESVPPLGTRKKRGAVRQGDLQHGSTLRGQEMNADRRRSFPARRPPRAPNCKGNSKTMCNVSYLGKLLTIFREERDPNRQRMVRKERSS